MFRQIVREFANDVHIDSCTSNCFTVPGTYEGCSHGSPSSRNRAPGKPSVAAYRLYVCRLSISAARGMGVNGRQPLGTVWKNRCVDYELLNWEGQTDKKVRSDGQGNSFI